VSSSCVYLELAKAIGHKRRSDIALLAHHIKISFSVEQQEEEEEESQRDFVVPLNS